MAENHRIEKIKLPTCITEHDWSPDTIPLVSISCVTYNHRNYIKDALEGFLMQKTTFPVRIVIFDDCSTDGTREIVQEYEAKYPDLIKGVYPKENTYQKPNRQEALKPRDELRNVAKYIALCEGDDYWIDPLKLQKQVDFLEANPEYVMTHSDVLFKYGNNLKYTKDIFINSIKDNLISTQESILSGKYVIRTCTVLIKSNILHKVKNNNSQLFSGYFLMGDTPLWYSLSKFGLLHFLSDQTAVYRISSYSATKGNLKKRLRFTLSMYEMRYYLVTKDNELFTKEYSTLVQDKYEKALYHYKLLDNNFRPKFPNKDNDYKYYQNIFTIIQLYLRYLLSILKLNAMYRMPHKIFKILVK